MKTYRCGYCGRPCDEQGYNLHPDIIKTWTELDWNNAKQVYGECCVNEWDF